MLQSNAKRQKNVLNFSKLSDKARQCERQKLHSVIKRHPKRQKLQSVINVGNKGVVRVLSTLPPPSFVVRDSTPHNNTPTVHCLSSNPSVERRQLQSVFNKPISVVHANDDAVSPNLGSASGAVDYDVVGRDCRETGGEASHSDSLRTNVQLQSDAKSFMAKRRRLQHTHGVSGPGPLSLSTPTFFNVLPCNSQDFSSGVHPADEKDEGSPLSALDVPVPTWLTRLFHPPEC
jgi:hypothetical protein